jgi:hypothetical protein
MPFSLIAIIPQNALILQKAPLSLISKTPLISKISLISKIVLILLIIVPLLPVLDLQLEYGPDFLQLAHLVENVQVVEVLFQVVLELNADEQVEEVLVDVLFVHGVQREKVEVEVVQFFFEG